MINPETCPRCGAPLSVYSMSRFNTDMCCMECLNDERQSPGYETARAEEDRQVRAGNMNFAGVGLSDEDRAFLDGKLAARP